MYISSCVNDDLKLASSSWNALRHFVDGEKVVSVVNSIGRVELEAAKHALSQRDLAYDKHAQLRSTITHLETAHAAFRSSYNRNPWQSLAALGEQWEAAQADLAVTTLLVICYLYVGETKLAFVAVDDLEKTWNIYAMETSDTSSFGAFLQVKVSTALHMFNPLLWPRFYKIITTGTRREGEEFEQLCQNLRTRANEQQK